MDSIYVAIAFMSGWTMLAIAMLVIFLRLMRKERDTRLPEEYSLTPQLELIGRANINRSSWSPTKMARLSLYDDFLVASSRSRRVLMRYGDIVNLADDAFRSLPGLRIQGPKSGELHRPDIRFAAAEAQQAKDMIASHRGARA